MHDQLLEIFGGYTVGPKDGNWRDPETDLEYPESIQKYFIQHDESKTNRITTVLRWAVHAFKQKAIRGHTDVPKKAGFITRLIYDTFLVPLGMEGFIFSMPDRRYGIFETILPFEDNVYDDIVKKYWNKPVQLSDIPILGLRVKTRDGINSDDALKWIKKECKNGIILFGDKDMLEHDPENDVVIMANYCFE